MSRHRYTKKKQRSKQRGGKYVGQGAYGCGFNPEILCVGQADREPGMFSKLMKIKAAVEENFIKPTLKKIDPTEKYLFYPQTMCRADIQRLDPIEDDVEKCDIFGSDRDAIIKEIQNNSFLLKYKDGGANLENVALKPEEFIPFFRDLVQVLEGLFLMHTNNFYHLDIKRGNIVHKKTSKRSYSFHYIDFGLSLLGDIPIAQNSLLNNNYFAWPFETRFVHPLFESKQITNGSMNEFYGKEAALYCQDLYPTEVLKDVNGIALGNVTLYKTLYNAVFDNPNYILRKTDIYSLGRVLSELYSLQFGHKMHHGTIFARKPSDIRNWTSISKLGLTLGDETMQWHTDLARDLSIPFFDLVKEMMNINMTMRINAERALSTYKSLLPMFEKYCSAKQISKHLSYYTPHLAILEPPTPPPTPSDSTQMPLNVTNLFASPYKIPKSYLKLVPSQVRASKNTSTRRALRL